MTIKIVLYTSPICPQCMRAKDFLTSQGLVFSEIDVSSDLSVASMLKEKTGVKLIPVIEINGTFYPGFNRSKLAKVLSSLSAKGSA